MGSLPRRRRRCVSHGFRPVLAAEGSCARSDPLPLHVRAEGGNELVPPAGRREKHERALHPEPLFATDQDLLAKAEADEAIEEALLRLSDQQREVVVMRIWGELTFPQIGEVLSISSSTADTRYRSGLKRLRLELDGKIST